MTMCVAMEKVDHIVRFCAAECQRQKTDAMSVYNMYGAVNYAIDSALMYGVEFDENVVLRLAKLVEPVVNFHDYRTTPVRFANFKFAMNADSVPRAMSNLFMYGDRSNPMAFTKEFLDVHPFGDGNGRMAAIVFNILNRTMNNPVPLPDFYSTSEFRQEADCYV